jgi:hypothetical protein
MNKNMEYSERWRYFIKMKCKTIQNFLDLTDIERSTLHGWTTNGIFPDSKRMKVIKECFPDLCFDWLLFGDGEPFIENPDGGDDPNEGRKTRVLRLRDRRHKKTINPAQAKVFGEAVPSAIYVTLEDFEELREEVRGLATLLATRIGVANDMDRVGAGTGIISAKTSRKSAKTKSVSVKDGAEDGHIWLSPNCKAA